MLIAREKRNSNIAEYILYMWQVEDLVRAYQFNMELIEKHLISQYKIQESVKEEMRNWYANIILTMHQEGLREKGHMNSIKMIIEKLSMLHNEIINANEDTKYLGFYNQARPNIAELKEKLPVKNINEIEVCLDGLYGLLLLRLKGGKVSRETEFAMQSFSNFLAVLSLRFKIEENKQT